MREAIFIIEADCIEQIQVERGAERACIFVCGLGRDERTIYIEVEEVTSSLVILID